MAEKVVHPINWGFTDIVYKERNSTKILRDLDRPNVTAKEAPLVDDVVGKCIHKTDPKKLEKLMTYNTYNDGIFQPFTDVSGLVLMVQRDYKYTYQVWNTNGKLMYIGKNEMYTFGKVNYNLELIHGTSPHFKFCSRLFDKTDVFTDRAPKKGRKSIMKCSYHLLTKDFVKNLAGLKISNEEIWQIDTETKMHFISIEEHDGNTFYITGPKDPDDFHIKIVKAGKGNNFTIHDYKKNQAIGELGINMACVPDMIKKNPKVLENYIDKDTAFSSTFPLTLDPRLKVGILGVQFFIYTMIIGAGWKGATFDRLYDDYEIGYVSQKELARRKKEAESEVQKITEIKKMSQREDERTKKKGSWIYKKVSNYLDDFVTGSLAAYVPINSAVSYQVDANGKIVI